MPMPHSRDMEPEQPNLRPLTTDGDAVAPSVTPTEPYPVDESAQLVADLIEATRLVPPDRLALVRGRAARGSFSEALAAEGLAPREGVARMFAAPHRAP